jgi:hypothetical protein
MAEMTWCGSNLGSCSCSASLFVRLFSTKIELDFSVPKHWLTLACVEERHFPLKRHYTFLATSAGRLSSFLSVFWRAGHSVPLCQFVWELLKLLSFFLVKNKATYFKS